MVEPAHNTVNVPVSPKNFQYLCLVSAFLQYIHPWKNTDLRSNFEFLIICTIGISLVIVGVLIARSAQTEFKQINSSPKHGSQITKLQTKGIFKFSRNPLYLAAVLIMAGLGVAMNSVYFFLSLLIFMLYVQYYVIPKEERKLAELFGEQYKKYVRETGQWISVFGIRL